MVAFSKLVAYSLSVTFPLSVLAYLWWRKRNQVENYEKVGHVTGLYIYPVKSCKGISLDSGVCLIEGIQFDRRWVVMDKDEKPIKVADKPSLAVVTPHFEDEKYLCLNAPGMDTLKLDLEPPEDSKDIKDLKVSRMSSKSRYAGDEAAAWFSTYLDLPGCKVYQICEPRYCAEDTKWGNRARPMDKTGYASLSAYHIVTESSLDVLNENLSAPVGMDRFRANIVIGGTPPYAEDQWITKTVKVGDVRLRLLKQCGRCAVTTVDPDTGEKDKLEPLATLRRMRLFEDRDPRHGQAPFFGLQMAAENQGFVKLGDPVFVSC